MIEMGGGSSTSASPDSHEGRLTPSNAGSNIRRQSGDSEDGSFAEASNLRGLLLADFPDISGLPGACGVLTTSRSFERLPRSLRGVGTEKSLVTRGCREKGRDMTLAQYIEDCLHTDEAFGTKGAHATLSRESNGKAIVLVPGYG